MHQDGYYLNILNNPEFFAKLNPTQIKFANEYFTYPGYENLLSIALPSESKYRSDLDKLRDQYYTEIITGKKSIDAFDEYVSLWYKNGGEELTKEANDWYASK